MRNSLTTPEKFFVLVAPDHKGSSCRGEVTHPLFSRDHSSSQQWPLSSDQRVVAIKDDRCCISLQLTLVTSAWVQLAVASLIQVPVDQKRQQQEDEQKGKTPIDTAEN